MNVTFNILDLNMKMVSFTYVILSKILGYVSTFNTKLYTVKYVQVQETF